MNLNAVRVFVRDLAAAQSFYSDRPGLDLIAGGNRFGGYEMQIAQAGLRPGDA